MSCTSNLQNNIRNGFPILDNHTKVLSFMLRTLLVLKLLKCPTPDGGHLGCVQNGRHRGNPSWLPREIGRRWLYLPLVQKWCLWNDLNNYLIKPPDYIENLSASTTWHSRHVSPSDVTALRRRWPKTVLREMQRRGGEMERLRRQACRRPEWAYRHSQPGLCPIHVCKTWVESSLEVHMMCFHLELGQLWRCPVEWCAVWKGSVSDCREHFNDKHGGSTSLEFGNASRSFPPWTVTWKIWQTTL